MGHHQCISDLQDLENTHATNASKSKHLIRNQQSYKTMQLQKLKQKMIDAESAKTQKTRELTDVINEIQERLQKARELLSGIHAHSNEYLVAQIQHEAVDDAIQKAVAI